MKTKIVIHYFLFLAIVLGAFASMAQNDYGLSVISWACFFFALIFLIDLIRNLKRKSWDKLVELTALAALTTLFGLRALYVYFNYIELILSVTCASLILVYANHGLHKMRGIDKENNRIRNLVILYYSSIIIFTLSIGIGVVIPVLTEVLGIIAALFLGVFILGTYLYKTLMLDGVEIKTVQYLRNIIGNSAILMTGYLLISIYSGLHMLGGLPPLYTDEIPHTYIELINDAETGKEKPINGKYKHEVYKEAYDSFITKYPN